MNIDLAIVLLFVIYSVCAGFRARKKASQNLEEYFLAGRTLKGWRAGVSMAATQYAADTPLLVTGLVATAGIFSLWRLWIYAIAFLLLGFFFSGCWRRSGVLTDAELTELRYAGKGAELLRILKAIYLGTIFNCCVLAMVLIAAVRIAEPFLTWHQWLPIGIITPIADFLQALHFNLSSLSPEHTQVWVLSASNLISILFILLFTLFYSTTGGLRGVVATDIVQFAIVMIATAVYAWIVLGQVGGFSGMVERLGELYSPQVRDQLLSFAPPAWNGDVMLILGVFMVQWFAQSNSDGTGYLAQRCMACKDDKEARNAALLFTFLQVVVRSLLWLPIVLGLLILYPVSALPLNGEVDEVFRMAREGTFVTGIRDFMPVGLRGLMLTGMLAALASTIDTHLNWGSSYWTNDIYKRFVAPAILKRESSPRELVWVARFSNVGLIVIALMIMARLSSIQGAWHMTLLFGSGLGVVLILRWLWYRINIYSEYAAALSSLLVAPILLFGFPEMQEGLRLLILLAVSTTALLLVTLLTKPESSETLLHFYRKVKPPGFWGPVAEEAGDSPGVLHKQFWQMSRLTLLSSVLIFGILIGVGKLFFSSP